MERTRDMWRVGRLMATELVTPLMVLAITMGVGCKPSATGTDKATSNARLSGPQLCIARHAQAYKNLSPAPVGMTAEQLDALTPEGVRRAKALGEELGPGSWRMWSAPANRVQQTAREMARGGTFETDAALRPLDGAMGWDERLAMWARGEDPRPRDGESLADGQSRAQGFLAGVREALGTQGRGVVVTHGDMAALMLGEMAGTPLLQRPVVQMIDPGTMRCVSLAP